MFYGSLLSIGNYVLVRGTDAHSHIAQQAGTDGKPSRLIASASPPRGAIGESRSLFGGIVGEADVAALAIGCRESPTCLTRHWLVIDEQSRPDLGRVR